MGSYNVLYIEGFHKGFTRGLGLRAFGSSLGCGVEPSLPTETQNGSDTGG